MEPATYDPELLLQHADWVRALARRLVRGEAAAEDVAQETWLALLRRPPAAGRPVRPWIAAVARNQARQRGRAERRRAEREQRVARSEAVEAAEGLDVRVALQQWVVCEVQGLAEPYRHTILLRYFEGLAPRKIAARTGVPVETVKSRLQRGLARLRQRIDTGCGPGGTRGLQALAPLLSPGSGGASLATGALLMGKKSVLLVALSVALFFGGRWVFGGIGALEAPGSAGEPAVVQGASDTALGAPSSVPQEDVVGEAASAAERVEVDAGGGGITVRVFESGTGTPVADARVWSLPWSVTRGRRPQRARDELRPRGARRGGRGRGPHGLRGRGQAAVQRGGPGRRARRRVVRDDRPRDPAGVQRGRSARRRPLDRAAGGDPGR